MPLFQIFTNDFRERKKYQKFRNAFMAGDVKKMGCEFMADIIQPMVNKVLQKNKQVTQSESLQVEKSRLKTLIKKEKELIAQKREEKKRRLEEAAKNEDPEKTKQEYMSSYLQIQRDRYDRERNLKLQKQVPEKSTHKIAPNSV